VILSFCEATTASGHGRWHLRWLDDAGPKFGGGITTAALCGHPKARWGWDLEVAVTAHHLEHNACLRCLAALADRAVA
jgi:hypothetical protein